MTTERGTGRDTADPRARQEDTDRRTPSAESETVGIQPRESALTQRVESVARSPEEAEARYVAARDAWTAAMRAANSGRPADLATLAVAQEVYEAATAERDAWASGARTPIPVESDHDRAMDAIVGQQLAWRRVHEAEPPKRGMLGRLTRRIRGG